ncbi:ABC transporter ATP-binding protein [Novispirillum itersonii]|uniref:Iron complex transport system ATP-binding protein n=1 Tax=Novispirillum itersonii TaxID=189 RepID=A0A7W9ZGQ9_NOVIT|nr:ABC transporter ATP-binding protein [Novispirillum itersonii]MBB6211120.1 iron complex transport system ATP-binding protein [Novispirillum itersonii]
MSLVITGLTVGYGARRIFSGLDLPEIRAGRVTALVGPNGAGKSTVLRAIAGGIAASGQVFWKENDLLRMDVRARSRIIGFMPQGLRDTPGLSVLDSVIASLRVFAPGLPMSACRGQALTALSRVGMIDLALRPLAQVSGGQRQLAGLAQSLVRDPAVLLLDEPTSALDLRHQTDVMGLLKGLAAEGRTIVTVLHDLSLAANWADEIIVLADGGVYAAGPARTVLTPDLFRSVYRVQACTGQAADGGTYVVVTGPLEPPP